MTDFFVVSVIGDYPPKIVSADEKDQAEKLGFPNSIRTESVENASSAPLEIIVKVRFGKRFLSWMRSAEFIGIAHREGNELAVDVYNRALRAAAIGASMRKYWRDPHVALKTLSGAQKLDLRHAVTLGKNDLVPPSKAQNTVVNLFVSACNSS